MNDNEFVQAEINFKHAAEQFKNQCDEFGVDAADRITDVLMDVGFDHVEIAE